jgi:uncharacterized protein HemX
VNIPGLSTIAAKIAAGAALAAILALGVVMWRADAISAQRDAAREALVHAEAELVLLRTDAALKETAAEERQRDTEAIAAAEKELIDAIKEVPDSQPDAVRVRLGCERLRRAGHLDADLPAVCRSGSGVEAEARS